MLIKLVYVLFIILNTCNFIFLCLFDRICLTLKIKYVQYLEIIKQNHLQNCVNVFFPEPAVSFRG